MPTGGAQPLRFSCAPCSAMLWVCLKRMCLLILLKGIRSQDILFRLANRRLYIGAHAQEHLAGLVAEWQERLTRWNLRV